MKIKSYHTDVAVIGGSLGGVQAARSLLEEGHRVVLSEQSNWIGGQLTSQAVPPDEHPWIEQFGCTRKYREFRRSVRTHYLGQKGFLPGKPKERNFDPGCSTVSRLSHLPSLAHDLLRESLKPYEERLTILTGFKPESVTSDEKAIHSVTLINESGEKAVITSKIYIDGTDQGDLLPLSGAAYRIGSESYGETGEPSAPETGSPRDLQPVTWVLSLGLNTGESPISRPEGYEKFLSMKQPYGSYPLFSRFGPDGSSGGTREFGILDPEEPDDLFSLWTYRRIQYSSFWKDARPDITLLNWPQNDYSLGNIIENSQADEHFYQSKEFSFSFLYWLQTDAPRPSGSRGYPEIGLVHNILGTKDGAAQFPYIREGRRLKALTTIGEKDISAQYNPELPRRKDSCGVGSYHLDMHVTTESHTFYYKDSVPFEIPLGALIPEKMINLLTASKNIGTTHITNGSFRLHPVEWNIGEAAGYLAHFALRHSCSPAEIRLYYLAEFQIYLKSKGVEIAWPDRLAEEWKQNRTKEKMNEKAHNN